MLVLHLKIKNYLLKAGWYENREVDISDCIKSFDRDNIKLTDSTISFMKEFYNLTPIRWSPLQNIMKISCFQS